MINQLVIVGKVVEVPELKETNNGIKYTNLVLDVIRSYKNSDGNYEHDKIGCTLWRGTAESIMGIISVGSIVGLKGRIQSNEYTIEEKTYTNYEIIAEKVSFLSEK